LPAQPIGDSFGFASQWSSTDSAAAASALAGLRTSLHQAVLLGMSWYDQLAVVRYQHWQRVGLLRKTIWKYGADAVAKSISAHRLTVSSLSWAGGFTGAVGFSFREAVADGRQALREAQAVSAETLVIVPGGRAGHTFRHARRLVVDGLRFLVDDAAERRLKLAILVSPPANCATWSCLAGGDDALHVIEEVGSPIVGLACPLPRGDGHPALVDRWQRICRRAWIAWTDIESAPSSIGTRYPGLDETLRWLVDSGFGGVWELRSWAHHSAANPCDQRARCRAISEALGLPERWQPVQQAGGLSPNWSEYGRFWAASELRRHERKSDG
jgi:hypothetical protein